MYNNNKNSKHADAVKETQFRFLYSILDVTGPTEEPERQMFRIYLPLLPLPPPPTATLLLLLLLHHSWAQHLKLNSDNNNSNKKKMMLTWNWNLDWNLSEDTRRQSMNQLELTWWIQLDWIIGCCWRLFQILKPTIRPESINFNISLNRIIGIKSSAQIRKSRIIQPTIKWIWTQRQSS